MSEILGWITANQALLIVAIVAVTILAYKYIDYRAKSDPAFDKWDEWAPTSKQVAEMIFNGAEWWGKVQSKAGDEKLEFYLKKLKEFEAEFSRDKLSAIQKLIAWYLSMRKKVPAPNPSTEVRPIGPDDQAA